MLLMDMGPDHPKSASKVKLAKEIWLEMFGE